MKTTVWATESGKWAKSVKIQDLVNMLKEYSLIFTTSFLWHESEDIDQKSLFPKLQLIPTLRSRVMHDYVCFIPPIDYDVE